jgi:dTDP-4-amino-4,6-dideoxygalactose transaminase
MRVPMLDLAAQLETIEPDVRQAIDRVLESQRFILGPEVERLERRIARRIGVPHAIGVSSGSDALLCSLMAAGVAPGDEVIVTPFSFFATVGCIVRMSAIPVFADIDSETYNLDPEAVADAVSPRTRAVIVVHLFGQCADMDPIVETARQHGLVVIEDAAQALGARYRGRPAGSLGDLGCFSFFPSKNLGAYGDAGMVVTGDERLAERCRLMRGHGASPKYHHPILGGNFRLDAIQAAVLNAKLPYLADWNAARARHAARYNELFQGSPLRMPVTPSYGEPVFHQYVVRVPSRDAVRERLRDRGVATEVYYPEPLHTQPALASFGYGPGDCPRAEAAAKEVLALPIYPELTADMQTYVAKCLLEAIESCSPAPAATGAVVET